ncbi:MAG: response regulator [Nitrospiraceae bacterium]|nr:response regulator [Nitrospiraceae bacterium]
MKAVEGLKGLKGLSILITAENFFVHHYFSRLFAKRHHLRMTASGGDAINELSQRRYDLVFVNEYLPDMGLTDMLAAIRRSRPDAKSLVMLTHREDENCLITRHGAAGVMIKPFTIMDILRMADRVLPAGASRDLFSEYALRRYPVMPPDGL